MKPTKSKFRKLLTPIAMALFLALPGCVANFGDQDRAFDPQLYVTGGFSGPATGNHDCRTCAYHSGGDHHFPTGGGGGGAGYSGHSWTGSHDSGGGHAPVEVSHAPSGDDGHTSSVADAHVPSDDARVK